MTSSSIENITEQLEKLQIQKVTKPKIQKPFIKWVGGKTQLLTTILEHVPSEINDYYEPFVGGGSVLLGILSLMDAGQIKVHGSIVCSDTNQQLINLYQCMQSQPRKLYQMLTKYLKEYDSIDSSLDTPNNRKLKPRTKSEGMQSKESYYYWIRIQYNKLVKSSKSNDATRLKECGYLLFLNKTCFRGMYREGPNGFNVPYGHYKKTPKCMKLKEFEHISIMIQNVKFECCDFSKTLDIPNNKKSTIKDFVYIDPPYVPLKSTSFVTYNKEGFSLEQHNALFETTNKLSHLCNVMMSNSNTPLVKDAFEANEKIKIQYITARRAINAKNPGSTAGETLIGNVFT